MIKQTKIIDPLKELLLSGNENLTSFEKLNELLKINHHSPTSSSMPLGIYAFRYLFTTQEQRSEFDGSMQTWLLELQSMMQCNGITQMKFGRSIQTKEN
jgi:hypothetical protein